jgi:hypothetical protein
MSSDSLRGALVQLQQLPVGSADDGDMSELENEAASLLLRAWQDLCASAAASSSWGQCGGA